MSEQLITKTPTLKVDPASRSQVHQVTRATPSSPFAGSTAPSLPGIARGAAPPSPQAATSTTVPSAVLDFGNDKSAVSASKTDAAKTNDVIDVKSNDYGNLDDIGHSPNRKGATLDLQRTERLALHIENFTPNAYGTPRPSMYDQSPDKTHYWRVSPDMSNDCAIMSQIHRNVIADFSFPSAASPGECLSIDAVYHCNGCLYFGLGHVIYEMPYFQNSSRKGVRVLANLNNQSDMFGLGPGNGANNSDRRIAIQTMCISQKEQILYAATTINQNQFPSWIYGINLDGEVFSVGTPYIGATINGMCAIGGGFVDSASLIVTVDMPWRGDSPLPIYLWRRVPTTKGGKWSGFSNIDGLYNIETPLLDSTGRGYMKPPSDGSSPPLIFMCEEVYSDKSFLLSVWREDLKVPDLYKAYLPEDQQTNSEIEYLSEGVGILDWFAGGSSDAAGPGITSGTNGVAGSTTTLRNSGGDDRLKCRLLVQANQLRILGNDRRWQRFRSLFGSTAQFSRERPSYGFMASYSSTLSSQTETIIGVSLLPAGRGGVHKGMQPMFPTTNLGNACGGAVRIGPLVNPTVSGDIQLQNSALKDNDSADQGMRDTMVGSSDGSAAPQLYNVAERQVGTLGSGFWCVGGGRLFVGEAVAPQSYTMPAGDNLPSVKIYCVEFSGNRYINGGSNNQSNLQFPPQLLYDKTFSDMTILGKNGEAIRVHKVVIASRSAKLFHLIRQKEEAIMYSTFMKKKALEEANSSNVNAGSTTTPASAAASTASTVLQKTAVKRQCANQKITSPAPSSGPAAQKEVELHVPLSSSSLAAFVEYLYTEDLPQTYVSSSSASTYFGFNSSLQIPLQSLPEVLIVAKQFDLPLLSHQVEDTLTRSLNAQNAFTIYEVLSSIEDEYTGDVIEDGAVASAFMALRHCAANIIAHYASDVIKGTDLPNGDRSVKRLKPVAASNSSNASALESLFVDVKKGRQLREALFCRYEGRRIVRLLSKALIMEVFADDSTSKVRGAAGRGELKERLAKTLVDLRITEHTFEKVQVEAASGQAPSPVGRS